MSFLSSSGIASMQKLLLPVIASFFLFATCSKPQRQIVGKHQSEVKIDSLKKELKTLTVFYQKRMREITDSVKMADSNKHNNSFSSGAGAVYILNDPAQQTKSKLEKIKDFIPWTWTVLGFFVAYFSFMRTSRFKNYDFLAEVNKQLITYPHLTSFYDKQKKYYQSSVGFNVSSKAPLIMITGPEKIYFRSKLSVVALKDKVELTGNPFIKTAGGNEFPGGILEKANDRIDLISNGDYQPLLINGTVNIVEYSLDVLTQADKELDNKLRSFAFYKLNNFESILQNLKWSKWSKEFEAWQRYLVDTYLSSSFFSNAAEEGLAYEFFGPYFSKMLRLCHDKSEILKGYYPKDENETPQQIKAYNKKYNEIMLRPLWLRQILYKLDNFVNPLGLLFLLLLIMVILFYVA